VDEGAGLLEGDGKTAKVICQLPGAFIVVQPGDDLKESGSW
jgi:hypothetical protein